MDYNTFLSQSPFQVGKTQKENMILPIMKGLTNHHSQYCNQYARFLQAFSYQEDRCQSLADVPFLPVTVFKTNILKSIEEEDVFKVLTSSGTTGQQVSRIYLDRQTASMQQKVLCQIMEEFLGSRRIPFLIIDSPDIMKPGSHFTARGAAIAGFSIFASSITYGLTQDMEIDYDALTQFVKENGNKKVVIFGFTFLLWKFCQELEIKGMNLRLNQAVVLHGGGWKKLITQSVSPKKFKETIQQNIGSNTVCDYYGMAEQTGSIYMECECGHLHASTYSDILIRDRSSFKVLVPGKEGLIEVLSPLSVSYPGHAILTEDLGILLGEDDCPCGRKGKYFQVTGRMQKAEIRGCSDTYEYRN